MFLHSSRMTRIGVLSPLLGKSGATPIHDTVSTSICESVADVPAMSLVVQNMLARLVYCPRFEKKQNGLAR